MKAKDLIKLLETVDSDTEIFIYEGENKVNKFIILKYSYLTFESDRDLESFDIDRLFIESPGVSNPLGRKIHVLI